MISGIFFRHNGSSTENSLMQRLESEDGLDVTLYHGKLLLACGQTDTAMGMTSLQPISFDNNRLVGCWTGNIYNHVALAAEAGLRETKGEKDDGALFLQLYDRYGEACVEKINGKFSFVLFDAGKQRLLLGRDRFGMESLYYTINAEYLSFSSTIEGIFQLTGMEKQINPSAVGKFLLFTYNPGLKTFFTDVNRLPAAHFLRIEHNDLSLKRYWQLSFNPVAADEQEITQNLLVHLKQAVSLRLDEDRPPGIFLSGGMDSSTVVTLAAEKSRERVNTFSYRCRAVSFDESEYARTMAKFTSANHHECEYGSDDILLMPEIVRGMNEPFCDVGINIATYLLGKNVAASNTNYILTGDGGDELFGGHPVYEADKMARFIDPVPRGLLLPILKLFSALPDSDQKKNLSVKLKRFAESLAYPKELLSHRWRIYYTAKDFTQLTRENFLPQQNWSDLLEDILQSNREGNAPDLLSRCLYSDYQTAIDFYLRRNDLNRRFGLETRFPLLDHKLVEFCATMPSQLKIKGWFDTKYIFKKAMEGTLPHDIIYRKDKLGHSIPLKNWIRDDVKVKELILDHVSPAVVERRGFFNSEVIAELVNDHLAKRRNNSHRLWTLAVLEMWLHHFIDN